MTCKHVHLLIRDTDPKVIANSMQLIDVATFQLAHRPWVDDSLAREAMAREGRWSEAIAVGNLNFVEKMKNEVGYKAAHREGIESGGTHGSGSR